MKITDAKKQIALKACDKDFAMLYQNVDEAATRYTAALDSFSDLFGSDNDVRIFSAPGRTEVGGNHTDHQRGRVLAGSVDLDVIGVVSLSDDNIVHIKSEGFPADKIDITDLELKETEKGTAAALIRGMCAIFVQKGYKIGGFKAYTTSNVMKGSGLSSSAAFEVFVGTVLNKLFNDGKISPTEIAKISQRAECEYFGKPCGLLDQSASALGGFTAIDFKDIENPVVENVNFDLESHGYALCVVNTGGDHTNLTGDYAAITEECRIVSNFFGKNFLREVEPVEFFEALPELKGKVSDRALLRAIHFFNEDLRAEKEKEALKNDNFEEFLRLINESGNSSYKYLQNVYSTSDVHSQGIALGLALTEQYLMGTGKGAFRVHGGGFAGTMLCFIPKDLLAGYKEIMDKVFGKGSCHVLKIREKGGYEIVL